MCRTCIAHAADDTGESRNPKPEDAAAAIAESTAAGATMFELGGYVRRSAIRFRSNRRMRKVFDDKSDLPPAISEKGPNITSFHHQRLADG